VLKSLDWNGDAMLFTTYLANLRYRGLHPTKKFIFVMVDRGNNEVAPTREMVSQMLRDKKLFGEQWETRGHSACWPAYRKKYLKLLESEEAKAWMKKVAAESQTADIVLVCFEKDHKHCHRRLLAQEIVRSHPEVEYHGELRNI